MKQVYLTPQGYKRYKRPSNSSAVPPTTLLARKRMAPPWHNFASDDARSEYGDRVTNHNPFRYGIFDPHSLHGPVYAFPPYVNADWGMGNSNSSLRRTSRAINQGSMAIQGWENDSQFPHPMEFSTAAKLLSQSTERAIEFFYKFQDEFRYEIEDMEYASLQTTNQIWKNKIQFNETGHHKRRPGSKSKYKDNVSQGNNNDNNDNQSDQAEDINDQEIDHARSSNSKARSKPQIPIFHHLTQDLVLRIHDFNHALLPYSSTFSPTRHTNSNPNSYSTPSLQQNLLNRQIKPLQKHKAAQALQRKIIIATIDLARYMESMRTNYQDVQFALTEMEHMSDLLTRYWRTWGHDSGDGEEESHYLGEEKSFEREIRRRVSQTGREREKERERDRRRRSPIETTAEIGMETRTGWRENEANQEWTAGDQTEGENAEPSWWSIWLQSKQTERTDLAIRVVQILACSTVLRPSTKSLRSSRKRKEEHDKSQHERWYNTAKSYRSSQRIPGPVSW